MEEHQTARPRSTRGPKDVQMSKTLSYLLRHGADKAGLSMRPDGFVSIVEVLAKGRLGKDASEQRILELVQSCPKQRFAVQEFDGMLFIRANQGHTVKSVDREALLTKVDDASTYPVCLHGTSYKAWETIRLEGLCRMRRNEIHCAKAELGEAKSGIRGGTQVKIYIDLGLCLARGITWYESENGVLLTAGLGPKGLLPPGFFTRVVDVKSQTDLPFDRHFDVGGE